MFFETNTALPVLNFCKRIILNLKLELNIATINRLGAPSC
jgi:hypothetical protein